MSYSTLDQLLVKMKFRVSTGRGEAFPGQSAHTGQLRAELKRAGRPIGLYDGMIAGHARARGLIVVTNNSKQFEHVPGLRLAN